MKKATIMCPETVDSLSKTYESRQQGGTIIEVLVKTRAEFGERVRLDEISAERTIINSRWVASVKVIHVTAQDWRYLRGTERGLPSVIDAARQLAS
jgi:hypothetical protein